MPPGAASPASEAERAPAAASARYRVAAAGELQHSLAQDPQAQPVRKREIEAQVRFALHEEVVRTREGEVAAYPGDAILTGVAGEQWPVPKAAFARHYRAALGTTPGADGRYRSVALPVLARRMPAAFEVLMGDGRSTLHGRPGDWLVDYRDGQLGVVGAEIFAATYDGAAAAPEAAAPSSQAAPPSEPAASAAAGAGTQRPDSGAPPPHRDRVPLHAVIQRILLAGVSLGPRPAPTVVPPPEPLLPLIERVGATQREFNDRAIESGDRYRSAFWAIYLLSALAVLCAVLPLALGWDDLLHAMHPYAGAWAVFEVVLIGIVAVLYVRGHRKDWQGQWLAARTQAELAWYLPLLAPLVDLDEEGAPGNWYARIYPQVPALQAGDDIGALCARNLELARAKLRGAWADPGFVGDYARWAGNILVQQCEYHRRVARRHRALVHRVHHINTWLFILTAGGALTHLAVHSLWLSLLTIFFPALGASLHGALAQSESYRLAATSERLAGELEADAAKLREALGQGAGANAAGVRAAVREALGRILDEHQDWHMLVRPHHLPLA
jgi:hypothetical protein